MAYATKSSCNFQAAKARGVQSISAFRGVHKGDRPQLARAGSRVDLTGVSGTLSKASMKVLML